MSYKQQILNEAYFVSADLRGEDFTESSLIKANLSYADLRQANLTGANLTGAILKGALLDEAIFDKTILSGSEVTDTILEPLSVNGIMQKQKPDIQYLIRKIPELEEKLTKKLSSFSGVRLIHVNLAFPLLASFQKKFLQRKKRETMIGEFSYLEDGSELRILKAATSKEDVYLLVKCVIDYTSLSIRVEKVKKYSKFKSAWAKYLEFTAQG